MKFGVGKLGEEIMPLAFFVLTQYRRVTDGQTRCDRYYPRDAMLARVKKTVMNLRQIFHASFLRKFMVPVY